MRAIEIASALPPNSSFKRFRLYFFANLRFWDASLWCQDLGSAKTLHFSRTIIHPFICIVALIANFSFHFGLFRSSTGVVCGWFRSSTHFCDSLHLAMPNSPHREGQALLAGEGRASTTDACPSIAAHPPTYPHPHFPIQEDLGYQSAGDQGENGLGRTLHFFFFCKNIFCTKAEYSHFFCLF